MNTLVSRRRPELTIALLSFAMLIVAVDFNIVYLALSEIRDGLGFSAQSLQWVVSAYAVSYGGFLLLGGRAVDRLGPRRMFTVALMIYAVSSLIGGLAANAETLVAARAAQGLGGAVLFPATLALINTNFDEGPLRNRAMAAWGAAAASGLIIGSTLGGVLIHYLGWQWVFFVNIPLALTAMTIGQRLLGPDLQREGGRAGLDLPGALIATAGSTLVVFGLVSGPEVGWRSLSGAGALTVGVVLLVAFLLLERHTRDPLMPARMLRNRSLIGAMALVVIFMTTINGLHYVYFFHLQNVLGYSALEAGLAFLPVSLGGMLGSGKVLPVVIRRWSLRWALFAGVFGMGIGTSLLAVVMSPQNSFWAMVPGTFIWGFSAGLAFSGIFLAAGAGVAPDEQGMASAMASTTQQIGGAVGLAALVAVANASMAGHSDLVSGLRTATWVAALVAIVGAGFAFLLNKSDRQLGGEGEAWPDRGWQGGKGNAGVALPTTERSGAARVGPGCAGMPATTQPAEVSGRDAAPPVQLTVALNPINLE